MATLTPTMNTTTTVPAVHVTETRPMLRAYQALHIGFAAAPILAGADKFFNLLTNWEQYLAPVATRTTGLSAPTFMKVVGVIEVIAGIGVLFKPRIFGYVVSAWMVGIILNLLILGNYYDVALRDLGLALGAFALGQLAQVHDESSKDVTVTGP